MAVSALELGQSILLTCQYIRSPRVVITYPRDLLDTSGRQTPFTRLL